MSASTYTNEHGAPFTFVRVEDVPAHPSPVRCAILRDVTGSEVGVPLATFRAHFRFAPPSDAALDRGAL